MVGKNIMKIPYYWGGEMVVLEGETAQEILKHIQELREDGTLVMKDCHVEGETLCLN